MVSSLGRTAREQLTARDVLSLIAFLALVYGVTKDVETVLVIAFGFAFVEATSILRETPTVDSRWVGVGLGAFITVASLAWLGWELTATTGTGGPVWFPALTALIGVWFLFDARADFADSTSSDEPDDMSASEVMLVMNHAHLVVEELKQGPKTVTELADACNLTESRIREVLDFGTDDGMIYPVDTDTSDTTKRYALDESKVGGLAFVRSNGKRILRRLARPFQR
ncbi:hypothetical protein Hlac_2878 [Halorubrum lacusprofundi ATCC 49239]|jgi:hypothetical protein|uniref:Uncharacterized protein n=1 Tax=Halorubrum lacusprofundi (strain ATCC 49239 / DSM 5036 / JCM 8891 / ACAM 34) TaxID=416348 RepID=B9LW47_HALLT|nr:hypothetical protein [Halorubrum lacusprofundi]ACM58437.1 hypothetical protein Hlac_2878 [Halorubrum lacusprofundi ATCC 49239]